MPRKTSQDPTPDFDKVRIMVQETDKRIKELAGLFTSGVN